MDDKERNEEEKGYFIDKWGRERVSVPNDFFTDKEKQRMIEDDLFSEEVRKHFKLGSYDKKLYDKGETENKTLFYLFTVAFWLIVGVTVWYFFL